ncbi:MAG: sensor histidine kinase [Spirochaetes bacterium]|nr:sensor histidine kinase [Spirochaetota bacterium]
MAQVLALLAAVLALLGLSGYLYVTASGNPLDEYTAMALPTALVELMLGAGLIFSILKGGPMESLALDSLGGRLLRWTVPVLLILQFSFEWVRVRGMAPGAYEESLGLKLLFSLNPIVILFVMLYAARSIDRSDASRQAALSTLHELNAQLEDRVARRTADLHESNRALTDEISERKKLEAEMAELRERIEERLGQRLHDGIAQDLFGLTLATKELQHEPSMAPERKREAIQGLHAGLLDCCRAVKQLAREIYPPELAAEGLARSLEDLASHVEIQQGVRCHLSIQPGAVPSRHDVAIHLFYIVQEAVKNAIRHGRATKIHLRLHREGPKILLEVQDNGIGFLAGQPAEGIGLKIIRNRAKALGARLEIQSQPGAGTIVHCALDSEVRA